MDIVPPGLSPGSSSPSSSDDNKLSSSHTNLNSSPDQDSFDDNINTHPSEKGAANVVDEIESDYEYEYEDDDNHFSGFLVTDTSTTTSTTTASITTSTTGLNQHSTEESSPLVVSSRQNAQSECVEKKLKLDVKTSAWREPSQAAVSMSLRAESEKTGSRRRLCADLYRIMSGDTLDQGFCIEPKDEDSMEKWRIKLFQFDDDSNLAKDLNVLGLDHVELEMTFPDQYPFSPPFVRVVRPRFKRQTGFVMNGALCMELLTNQGWNPVNDIESVIVSIRSLLVVGDGRLQAAVDMEDKLHHHEAQKLPHGDADDITVKPAGKLKERMGDDQQSHENKKRKLSNKVTNVSKTQAGTYTAAEARAAYSHLSDYHRKKGWDSSGWWARKG